MYKGAYDAYGLLDGTAKESTQMCLQEIDIINDVVHYKSAYYGTVMVGSPP